MSIDCPDQENMVCSGMAEEDKIREKTDENSNKWVKVYFGSGEHFKNWLSQSIELSGEENIMVEEADSKLFQCYDEGGEKMYRIWVRENVDTR